MYTVTFDISEDRQDLLCYMGLADGELDTDDACAHWAAAFRLIAEEIVDQIDLSLPYHTHAIPVTFNFSPFNCEDHEDEELVHNIEGLLEDLKWHGSKALHLYEIGQVSIDDILRFSTWNISVDTRTLSEISGLVGGLAMPHVKWAMASAAALEHVISATQRQNAA